MHAMDLGFPPEPELTDRLRRLQALMDKAGLQAALILQNADLIWIAGTYQAEAAFVPRSGDALLLAKPPLDRIREEAPSAAVDLWPSPKELRNRLEAWADGPILSLGLELDVLPVNLFRRIETALPGTRIEDVSPLIRRLRSIKSDFELGLLRRAAEALDEVFRTAARILPDCRTELDLEGRLTGVARALGHQGLIRGRGFNMELALGHVLAGENGLAPAKVASPTGGRGVGPGFGQGASHRPLGPDELISVDLCTTFGGYTVDQARLFFTGPVPSKVQDVYARLLDVIEALKARIRPGLAAGRVYDLAFELAHRHGLDDGFMGLEDPRCPFIGHGVGLELDEWPVLARGMEEPLAAGMVFALEPRVFLPGVGVVGLEDTYLLTEDGPEKLTRTPVDIVSASFNDPLATQGGGSQGASG
jgi:Xaa-Pro dipeptidase